MRKKRTTFAAVILIASLFMAQNINYAESVSERVVTTSGDLQEADQSSATESSKTQETLTKQESTTTDPEREGKSNPMRPALNRRRHLRINRRTKP